MLSSLIKAGKEVDRPNIIILPPTRIKVAFLFEKLFLKKLDDKTEQFFLIKLNWLYPDNMNCVSYTHFR